MIKKITLLMMLLPVFGFGQLATFNFFGSTEVATLDATTVDANLNQAVTMTRGAGAAPSAGGNSFRTVGFMNDGIDVNNTDYFQFQIEALAGFKMSLTSIDAQVRGTASFLTSNSNGGALNQFAYSLDGITFTLIGSPLLVTVNNSALPSTDLSAVAALQDVAAGTVVTFRFYATGQTATGGWGFTSGSATTEDFVVDGTSTAISGGPCPTLAAPTAAGVSICGNSTATLNATSPETGSILTWYNVATGGSSLFTGSPFVTPLLSATTSYWVQDSISGCTAGPRTEVIVNVSGTAPTATALSNSPICAGSALNLTANTVPGATYGWTGPNSFTSAVQNPTIASATALASGTYNLTITDGGCTSAVSSIAVVVNSLPVVSAGADKDVCAGLPVTLTGSGATTYVWDNNVTNNVSFVPSATAIFTVVGTDANGCTGSDMVEVTVNALPVVTVAANGLTLTASLSSVDYQWINCDSNTDIATATAQTYTATANGSYKVEVTDAN